MNINNEEITGKIIEREKKIRFLRAKKVSVYWHV